jgi:hypothetical protein
LIAAILRDKGPDFPVRPDFSTFVVYEAMTFVSDVYGMLVTLKTLLDVFAPLVTRAIAPGEVLRGFNKDTFEGASRVPGGNLLNWLKFHSGADTAEGRCAAQLFEIVKREVFRWIATAVKWRDAAVHSGRLMTFIPMHVVVKRTFKTIREDEVVGPFMPDKTPVVSYANDLLRDAAELVDTSVRLLPGVDTSLLASSSWKGK